MIIVGVTWRKLKSTQSSNRGATMLIGSCFLSDSGCVAFILVMATAIGMYIS
jgi:hypothetical protein